MMIFTLSKGGLTCGLVSIFMLLALTHSSSSFASIESEPVKVTSKNSGPKYDFNPDDVERTKLADTNENLLFPVYHRSPAVPAANRETEQDSPAPVGHVTIRRIFLVPAMPSWPAAPGMFAGSAGHQQQPAAAAAASSEQEEQPELPSLLMRGSPFWPFFNSLHGAAAPRPHLLGADQASRSPFLEGQASKVEPTAAAASSSSSSGEREESTESSVDPQRAMIDPFRMVLDLMRNVLIHGAPQGSAIGESDLSKDASETPANTDSSKPTSLDRQPPKVNNETREEIVELDGKKYLRKTVITRRVSDDMFFITRRLIFVPLNETETSTTQATPANAVQVSSTTPAQLETSTKLVENIKKQPELEVTSTTTTTTTMIPPTAASSTSQVPLASSNSPTQEPLEKETSTPALLEAITKAATEAAASSTSSTTTDKPNEATTSMVL